MSVWGGRGREGGGGKREEGGRPMRVAFRRFLAEDKAAAGQRPPNVPRTAPLEPRRSCRHACRHVRSGQKGGGGERGRVMERLTSLHSLHHPSFLSAYMSLYTIPGSDTMPRSLARHSLNFPAALPPCSLLLFLPSPTRESLTSLAGTRSPWVSAWA